MILTKSFYGRNTLVVARALLGQVLVHEVNEQKISGKIVETEAYLQNDPAAHSFRGLTPRCAPMFGPPGVSYVYFIYGMYHCFNVVTERDGYAGAVLVRALAPVLGIAQDQKTNGPGKLCRALHITRNNNNKPLTKKSGLYIVSGEKISDKNIVKTTRIGITDAAHEPYRFYIKGNLFISKP